LFGFIFFVPSLLYSFSLFLSNMNN
jgi:hypothetical protein